MSRGCRHILEAAQFSGATHLESSGTKRGGSDALQVPSTDAQARRRARGLGNDGRADWPRPSASRGDDLWLVTWRRCRGTAARLPAVPMRSRVPGTAGNRRERPTQNPSVFAVFAAFADVRGEVQGSEPATFHRGERFQLAFLSPFRRLCGLFAVPIPVVCHPVRLLCRAGCAELSVCIAGPPTDVGAPRCR